MGENIPFYSFCKKFISFFCFNIIDWLKMRSTMRSHFIHHTFKCHRSIAITKFVELTDWDSFYIVGTYMMRYLQQRNL